MFKSLKLNEFTAFAEADFQFVDGINVYVGVNGSGKTHILKLLYAIQKHQSLAGEASRRQSLDVVLMSVFKPDAIGRLVRRRVGINSGMIRATWNATTIGFDLNTKMKGLDVGAKFRHVATPAFIPAKDILGHSVNFVDAYDTLAPDGRPWLDFDVTYRDLLTLANPSVPRGQIPLAQDKLLRILHKQMNGTVVKSESGRFYLKNGNGKIEFPLLAEGWRKLGLLWTLIRNGTLSNGSVLYWDEPEANLNPSMFGMVAEILATLAVSGTQIHLATHSYALLKELDFEVAKHKAAYRIFTLDRTQQGVTVTPCNRFAEIDPNPILDEYTRIYQRTVEEALKNG